VGSPRRAGAQAPGRQAQRPGRQFARAADAVGATTASPYTLRHSFASLLIHEGRLSVIEIAAQLGHAPTTTLDTYAHVIAELRDAPRIGAAEAILEARGDRRGGVTGASGASS
jgi:integrase